MIVLKFGIFTLITICLGKAGGEHDFNFSDDAQTGCGVSYVENQNPIFSQFKQNLRNDSVKNVSGDKIGWWVISQKNLSKRVRRYKRIAEGSGEDYDQYDYGDEENEEIVGSITEIPSVTTHAHRHHHGMTKDEQIQSITSTNVPFLTSIYQEVSTDQTHNDQDSEVTTVIPSMHMYSTEDSDYDNIPKSHGEKISTPTTTADILKTTSPPTVLTTEHETKSKLEKSPPIIKTRLKKYTATSGKPFIYKVPLATFYDSEDGYNLRLELYDEIGNKLNSSSWMQFNTKTKEIYGLPMEDAVSKWQFKLEASDSDNETVTETVEISVYQHRGLRSVNHEISITVQINETNIKNIDWQIMLIQSIRDTIGDESISNVVVREIRQGQQDPHCVTFVYFNETLPTVECPEKELNYLLKQLNWKKLSESLLPKLFIKSVTVQLIGPCQKQKMIKSKPTFQTKNYPPVPRNQVDLVNATVGHLLVYKVPGDTFYDPNDSTELKLSLLTIERKEINPRHWLQFDSNNQEFYGVPKSSDLGSEEFLLVAEDSGGLTASDALVVVVNHAPKREFNVYFKAYLAIPHEQFNANMQRKFVERLSHAFEDYSTQFIQIRSFTTHHDSEGTIVNFYNNSLFKTNNRCPEEEIESVRKVYYIQDFLLRDKIRKDMGIELNLTNVQVVPLGSCHSVPDIVHRDKTPIKTEEPHTTSTFTDDLVFTFIIPVVLITVMILLAAVIAFFFHRRRITGKMDLGDEEERKSFRPKGIPVIFQDELDEKPEMGNKSPIILKDEKPPLLPPSYNQSNFDGEYDLDEYVPPPAVIVGSREIRGKSPATPSYRKPPPYVSP